MNLSHSLLRLVDSRSDPRVERSSRQLSVLTGGELSRLLVKLVTNRDRHDLLVGVQFLSGSSRFCDEVSPLELAILYDALGERDQAFASLEKAYEAHDVLFQILGVSPEWDPLRSDPRFRDLLRRVGLTP